jgi:hypothetical protein
MGIPQTKEFQREHHFLILRNSLSKKGSFTINLSFSGRHGLDISSEKAKSYRNRTGTTDPSQGVVEVVIGSSNV